MHSSNTTTRNVVRRCDKTKISKTVTLDYDNFDVVKQLMEKTRLNFSRTIDLIIVQWLRFQQDLRKEQAYIEQLEVKRQIEKFDQSKKAKVVKK